MRILQIIGRYTYLGLAAIQLLFPCLIITTTTNYPTTINSPILGIYAQMEQQSEPISLSSVYEAHATKNWSVKFICLGLKINEISYSDIYSTMEQGLADIQMLGLRLNEVRNRSRLDQVFRNVIETFPTVFTGIPEPWQSRCLSAIAQKCNNNRKRRVLDRTTTSAQIESVAHRLKSTNTRRPSKEGPELVARNSLVFGTVQTEVVCEGDGREMLCGCRYFTAGSTPDDKITSTDLDFSLFTGVLSEDIGFDPTKHGIFYCNSRGREMEVLTERTWRATIDEMYTEGLNRFYFTIRYKDQGEIDYTSNFSNIGNILTHLKVHYARPLHPHISKP